MIGEEQVKIGMLRADMDRGVGLANTPTRYVLVKLSDRSIIRDLKSNEDFDKAICKG